MMTESIGCPVRNVRAGGLLQRGLWRRFAALKLGVVLLALALLLKGNESETQAQTSAPLVPVINGYGLLLGASRGEKWISWEKTHSLIKGGEKYRFYNSKGPAGTGVGSKPELSEASGEAYYIRFSDRNDEEKTEDLIGLGGTWNPMPRMAKTESTNQKVYLDAVAAVLKEKGLTQAPPHITKILRVDLSGKGQDSVLIEAASPNYQLSTGFEGDPPKPNTYSFVMLRTLLNGRLKTFVLDGAFYKKNSTSEPAERYRIRHILDLNGDGALEIVVDSSYYEGGGTGVYELKNGAPKRVIHSSDGA